MADLAGTLSEQLSVQPGVIVGFEPSGLIMVRPASRDSSIPAHFLRTSQEAPPSLEVGDAVLVAVDAEGEHGYVIGVVMPYVSGGDAEARGAENARKSEGEIRLPFNAQKVYLKGQQIKIEAGEELQLVCGGGTILIDKRGKIVVRGSDIVSRARGANKIKGASVAIN